MFNKATLLSLLTLTSFASAGVLDYGRLEARSNHHALAARRGIVDDLNGTVQRISRRRESKRCKPREAAIETSISIQIEEPEPTTTKEEPKPTKEPKPEEPKPEPSSTEEEEPEWTPPPPPPPPETTDPPKPDPTSGGGGGGGGGGFMSGSNSGQATFYNTGLVACGTTHSDSEYIAAVAIDLFNAYPGAGNNPNKNPICGKSVTAHYKGKSVTVQIVDACVGCAYTDLDFTPSAFQQLADLGAGRLDGMTWEWA